MTERDKALQRGDVTAIAMYIYRAKRDGQENIDIPIHGFTFQCNPNVGVIKQSLQQVGGINQKLGEKSAETYVFNIQKGLMLAAKIHLLLQLKKHDPVLRAMININIETGTNLDERSVNTILGKLVQAKGSTLTTLVGMFAARPPQSPIMKVIREELSKAALKGIHSYQDAEQIYENISKTSPQQSSTSTFGQP